jgi:hypothetical protein
MTLFAELAVELFPAVYYGQLHISIGVMLTHSEPDVQSIRRIASDQNSNQSMNTSSIDLRRSQPFQTVTAEPIQLIINSMQSQLLNYHPRGPSLKSSIADVQ